MPLQHSFAMSMARYSILLLPLCAFHAFAGASLSVDDAAITPSGRCQVEAWARVGTPGQELTAAPACTFAGTEFGLSVSHYTRPRNAAVVGVGVKHLLRDFDAHDWGLGTSLGATWNGADGSFAGWNFALPFSVALDEQRRTVLHANLGWSAARHASDAMTAGLGFEHKVAEDWILLGEGYGDHRGGFGAQLGLRKALSEAASLDLIVGHQRGSQAAPWLTLGINVLLPN